MIRHRATLYAALLAACAIPDLDTAGNIRCGTEGLCPEGFQCRIGRCCPAAAPSVCPALPANVVGAPCVAGACTIDLGTRSISATCLPREPGGYCTIVGCDLNDSAGSCGEFGACVPRNSGATCVRRCAFDPMRPQPQPCRDLPGEVPAGTSTQYVCIKDPYDRTTTAGLCVPDCTRMNWCTGNTICDPTTRSCLPTDCRRTPNVCEPMGLSCDSSTGQCFRCSDYRGVECSRAGRPCGLVGMACRQRCSSTTPCPIDATCVAGLCTR